MNTKNTSRTNREVCKDCKGKGVISKYKETLPHWKGDVFECTKCATCDGQGMLEVTIEIRKTVKPIYRKESK